MVKVKKELSLKEWIRQERKRLYKGCGGVESYWGQGD